MTSEEIVFAALRAFDKRPGYSKLERMRDAVEAVAEEISEDLRWELAQGIEDEFVVCFVADEASEEQWKLREVIRWICPGWPFRRSDAQEV